MNPIKIHTLRFVWQNASKLDLPNSYMLYKTLYEHVLYSLSINSIQIVNQEITILSLLESMRMAKFKNIQLIQRVFKIIGERGRVYINTCLKYMPRIFIA